MRTNKQETFIEQYCLTGNASKAAETAGYSSPKQRGYDLKKQFGFEIAERQNQNQENSQTMQHQPQASSPRARKVGQ